MTKNARPSILVLEDEYFITEEIARVVEEHDARVVGPASTLEDARALDEAERVQGALLDINLRGNMSYDFARHLQLTGRPFAFISGYNRDAVPDEFGTVPLIVKPFSQEQLSDVCQWLVARMHQARVH